MVILVWDDNVFAIYYHTSLLYLYYVHCRSRLETTTTMRVHLHFAFIKTNKMHITYIHLYFRF